MVVNLITKLTALLVGTTVSAENLVVTIRKYWTTYEYTDMVISNLVSDLNSKLITELVKLMGTRHTFSIADRHGNVSERTIKEVVRHFRAIPYDSRIDDVFDDPLIKPSVQYTLNTHIGLKTSYFPFELTCGTHDVLCIKILATRCEGVYSSAKSYCNGWWTTLLIFV